MKQQRKPMKKIHAKVPKITEKGQVVPIGDDLNAFHLKYTANHIFWRALIAKQFFFVNKKFDKFDIKEMKREKRK